MNSKPNNCRFITNRENVRNGRRVKINIETASRIKLLLKENWNRKKIAELLSCSPYIIADIASERTWRDVL
jgi:hypothetical protein